MPKKRVNGLRITVDIFSGRKNPTIKFTGKEAKDVLERLRPARKLERWERELPPKPTLGYRGLRIEQTGKPVKDLLPEGSRVALIIPKDRKPRMPTPGTVLREGDQIIALTTPELEGALRAALTGG